MKLKEVAIYFKRRSKVAAKSPRNFISFVSLIKWFPLSFLRFSRESKAYDRMFKRYFFIPKFYTKYYAFPRPINYHIAEKYFRVPFPEAAVKFRRIISCEMKKGHLRQGWNWPSLVVNDSRKYSKKYLNWTN